MVAGVKRRLFTAIALLLAAAPLSTAGPASAAPSPGPTAVTIGGEDAGLLTVTAETDGELFHALLDQVNWLKGNGHIGSVSDDLGPKYTVVVLFDGVAKQTYDLYPLAAGGPRAYRPAKQPGVRKTGAAWFFGRLNMSETLRAAGIPLPETAGTRGGIGGGERVISGTEQRPGENLDKLSGELRNLVLLTGAAALLIAAGLAGTSLRVRRRTH